MCVCTCSWMITWHSPGAESLGVQLPATPAPPEPSITNNCWPSKAEKWALTELAASERARARPLVGSPSAAPVHRESAPWDRSHGGSTKQGGRLPPGFSSYKLKGERCFQNFAVCFNSYSFPALAVFCPRGAEWCVNVAKAAAIDCSCRHERGRRCFHHWLAPVWDWRLLLLLLLLLLLFGC